MVTPLQSGDDRLRDLADDQPLIIDAATKQPTGLRLLRWIGAGGMSAVFVAERDPSVRSPLLLPMTPRRVAVKIVKPSTEQELSRLNLRSIDITKREVAALDRVRKINPPTELIIGLYGSGSVIVEPAGDEPRELPWLALELVEGGSLGATLTDRVLTAQESSIDPVRALRLVRGIIEGVEIFHRFGVLHRDLKPDNVFVAGPIDDETPKIADCGIARVDGIGGGTISAATIGYAGPEQFLSLRFPTERNPLVGPWTDVHALAATIWFLLTGETWSRSPTEWNTGKRRSLRTARQIHRGFRADDALLDAIDSTLARGAAHSLPEKARSSQSPLMSHPLAKSLFAAKERRFATVAEFREVLLPLLETCAQTWIDKASEERVPVTQFRSTLVRSVTGAPAPVVRNIAPPANLPEGALGPGDVAFLPGQWGFCRMGEKVYCFSQTEPSFFEVPVPTSMRRQVAESRWLVRGPGAGFALVGPNHVLLVPRSDFVPLPLPKRPKGGEVGRIQAVIGDGRMFGVVTAETDDSNGGPELWTSADGATWKGPVILPLGGDAHALATGPSGLVVVGSRNGKRARAFILGHDRQGRVITDVNEHPPLTVTVSGPDGESWAAGAGGVLRLDSAGAAEEPAQGTGIPVAMGLDPNGIPWLVRKCSVLRRTGGSSPSFCTLFERGTGEPSFIAIGFTSEGSRLMDARGGGLLIEPQDSAQTIPAVAS